MSYIESNKYFKNCKFISWKYYYTDNLLLNYAKTYS